jgi:uncharacterized damage-inducible protein DinB
MATHLVSNSEERPAQHHQCEKYPQDHSGTQRQLTLALQVFFVFVHGSGHRGKLIKIIANFEIAAPASWR